MIFKNLFSGTKEKPEYVTDEVLSETMQIIVPALEHQVSTAREMSHAIPDGEARFSGLIDGSFFYGYVMGLTNRIAMEKFSGLIDQKNYGKNLRRLLQGVVANLFYPDTQPDWNAVLTWEAQVAAYGSVKNSGYEEGMKTGQLFGEEIINGPQNWSVTLLGAELLKP